MWKKIMIISLAIVVVVGTVFAVWQIFFAEKAPSPDEGQVSSDEGGSFPESGLRDVKKTLPEGKGVNLKNKSTLVRLSDEGNQVFEHWIYNGDPYYITTKGGVFRAKIGSDSHIAGQNIAALNKVAASPSGSLLLISWGDPKAPNWGVVDPFGDSFIRLSEKISAATWGESDSEIIALMQDGRLTRIASAESFSTNNMEVRSIVSSLFMKDVRLHWSPGRNSVLISEKPASFHSGSVWEVSPKTGEVNTIVAPARGLWLEIDRNNGFLFQFDVKNGFSITSSDMKGSLPMSTTFPNKCNVTERLILCAVPNNIKEATSGDGVPENYIQEQSRTQDGLYVMQKESGDVIISAISGKEGVPILDIENIEQDSNTLYFQNRYDDGLYKFEFPTSLIPSSATSSPTTSPQP